MLTLVLIFASLMYLAIAALTYGLLYVLSLEPFEEVIEHEPTFWSSFVHIIISFLWPIPLVVIVAIGIGLLIVNAWQSCRQYKPLKEYDNPIAALQEPKDIDYR